MSLINQLSTKKACKIITHRDLANAQRLADEKAINAISNWLVDMQLFNKQTPKENFLSNSSNKSALVPMILLKLSVSNISSICCRDDAYTTIVKESLQYFLLGDVGFVAEDADILIILMHHFDINIHKEIRIITSKGNYSVKTN